MNRIDKLELWRELDATDEAFVRRKLALGGYPRSHMSIVKEWLAARDVARSAAQQQAEYRVRAQTATLTTLGTLATVIIAAAALAELLQ